MMLRRFLTDKRGATSIEYAVIASLIGIVLVGALSSIGGTIEATFTAISAGF